MVSRQFKARELQVFGLRPNTFHKKKPRIIARLFLIIREFVAYFFMLVIRLKLAVDFFMLVIRPTLAKIGN